MEPTLNGTGFQFNVLEDFAKEFIAYDGEIDDEVLDIGCAFGIATRGALEAGGRVTACDLDQGHLDIVVEKTPEAQRERLRSVVVDAADILAGSVEFEPTIIEAAQLVDELVVADEGNKGSELVVVTADTGDVNARDLDGLHAAGTDFLQEVGVIDLVRCGFLIDVVEYRQQNAGDYHPENQVFCHVVQRLIPTTVVMCADSRSRRPMTWPVSGPP